jgi:hypothetical protein
MSAVPGQLHQISVGHAAKPHGRTRRPERSRAVPLDKRRPSVPIASDANVSPG